MLLEDARRLTTMGYTYRNTADTDQYILHDRKRGDIYHRAYFDNIDFVANINSSTLTGNTEHDSNPTFSSLLDIYYLRSVGYDVNSKARSGRFFHDFSVMIKDPRTPKLAKKVIGIDSKSFVIEKDLYNQLHTLVEIKRGDINDKVTHKEHIPLNKIFEQIQRYLTNSTRNTNEFVIAGFNRSIAFFIYNQNIHVNYPNKGKEFCGFIC